MAVENNGETPPQPITFQQRLKQFEEQLRNGEKVPPVSIRELLRWMGWQRRGSWVNMSMRNALRRAHLTTSPEFTVPYIDGLVEFRLADETAASAGTGTLAAVDEIVAVNAEAAADEEIGSSAPTAVDPTYRIGRLRSANVIPTTVTPNQTVTEAITIMLTNDFSQLPVMVGEREVKGVISWRSIGSRLVLGVKFSEVRECMEPAHVIPADTSLFDAITEIVTNQYIIVRDVTNRISGIVTTSDLSSEFQQLNGPFILLGEIENHVRSLIQRGIFINDQLRECCDDEDNSRKN